MTERSSTEQSRAPVWFWFVFAIAVLGATFPVIQFYIKARMTPSSAPCIAILKQIDGAKQQWALEGQKQRGEIPAWADLTPYLKGGVPPHCPDGGTYILGRVGENPSCTLGRERHSL